MRILVVVFALFVVACGDPTAPTPGSVAGTWSLQSVNGAGLPAVVDSITGEAVSVTSETLTATSAETWASIAHLRFVVGGTPVDAVQTDAGTFAISGSTVAFVSQSSGLQGTGTISGSRFTLAVAGRSTLVFKKN